MSHQLLDIQRLDVEADQLRHRRANLEQREQLAEALAEQARQQVDIDVLAIQRVEVATRQKRLEDEAQIVAARADEDETKLYGGVVSAMKDLQALQDEIAGLRRRQSDLEDQAIEVMEESEVITAQMKALESARASVDERVTVLGAEIAAAEGEIDGQLAMVAADRDATATDVDASQLADYERLRAAFGAATVVRFDGGNCVGCPSTMPAMEIDRMKREATGSAHHCDECGRIVLL